jgi:hypothetical protein
MADLVVTRYTTLAPEEALVRAVQFFTNETWRAQSQTNRVATFVGVPKIPWFQIMLAVLLTFCFVIPGLIYYILVIRKLRHLQNIVVTTTPKQVGCDVVVTYPSYAQRYVDSFLGALPGGAPQQQGTVMQMPPQLQQGAAVYCVGCGKEIAQGVKFCTGCGAASPSPAPPLPPA